MVFFKNFQGSQLLNILFIYKISTRDSIRYNFTPFVGTGVQNHLGRDIKDSVSPSARRLESNILTLH